MAAQRGSHLVPWRKPKSPADKENETREIPAQAARPHRYQKPPHPRGLRGSTQVRPCDASRRRGAWRTPSEQGPFKGTTGVARRATPACPGRRAAMTQARESTCMVDTLCIWSSHSIRPSSSGLVDWRRRTAGQLGDGDGWPVGDDLMNTGQLPDTATIIPARKHAPKAHSPPVRSPPAEQSPRTPSSPKPSPRWPRYVDFPWTRRCGTALLVEQN